MKLPVRSSVLVQLFLHTARSQRAFDGATVEVHPEHPIVPAIVMPQAFAGPWQTFPYPTGRAGTPAVQAREQSSVPAAVHPHAFAAEVQAFPYPAGRAGALTLQTPAQVYVPEFEAPQTLATEQALPRYQGFAGVTPLQAAAQS